MKLLILADDLTGALDSGVQLAKAGIKTVVTCDCSYAILKKWVDTQVLVIDTETRHITGEAAYKTVFDLAARAYENGFQLIYIKNDSTLRGNIGSALAAVLDATGGHRIYFVPAYPRLNRITRGAVQYVNNLPLAQTLYAKDPLNPVSKSSVLEIIAQQTDISSVSVSIEALSSTIQQSQGPQIVVIDAQNDYELSEIQKLLSQQQRLLLAGNSGFSATLPDFMGIRGREKEHLHFPKRTLVLCGSLNTCSQEQIRRAADTGVPCLVLSKEQLQENYTYSPAGTLFRQQLSLLLSRENCVIMQTCWDQIPGGQSTCLGVARAFGQLTGQILRDLLPDLVVIFGGDTLLGMTSTLAGAVLLPEREVLAGVVQSHLLWEDGSVRLVSKAGGFGEPDTLIHILQQYKIHRKQCCNCL